jgi:hypothetical protein
MHVSARGSRVVLLRAWCEGGDVLVRILVRDSSYRQYVVASPEAAGRLVEQILRELRGTASEASPGITATPPDTQG